MVGVVERGKTEVMDSFSEEQSIKPFIVVD